MRFFTIVDEYGVVRRSAFYTVLILTVHSYVWAAGFAQDALVVQGIEWGGVAATVLAVTAPISALQAFVFKWYLESRRKNVRA